MMRRLGVTIALGAALVGLVAARAPYAAQGGATISGKVKFTGAKPANARIDMSEEGKCAEKYKTPPTAETVVGSAGVLGNVFVYVKSGLPATYKAAPATTPVVIDQDGCHYKPHVLGVQIGQPLEIRNSDPVLHN